jgi:hypothetical protein
MEFTVFTGIIVNKTQCQVIIINIGKMTSKFAPESHFSDWVMGRVGVFGPFGSGKRFFVEI